MESIALESKSNNVIDIELLNQKVYIAGPMRGIPDRNHPLFFIAESYLKENGAKVMNPAVLPKGFAHEAYSAIGVHMMLACDMVAFLPHWEESAGARRIYEKAFQASKYLMRLETDQIHGNQWIKAHLPLII